MGDMPQIPFAASWFAALGLRPNLRRRRGFMGFVPTAPPLGPMV